MEILPITIGQVISIIEQALTDEERCFVANSTFEELKEFSMIDDFHIDEITALSSGNRALLEECSIILHGSDELVILASMEECEEIIVRKLIDKLSNC